jgi:hypothetical protein
MNINDLISISVVLTGLIAIPLVASTIEVSDDYKFGLATIFGTSPENITSEIPSLISKQVTSEGIKYVYRTPLGEYSILVSPEKIEQTLYRMGEKVYTMQSADMQLWEISSPSESLVINRSRQKIVERYSNINGYFQITVENGFTSTEKSGRASEEELLKNMKKLESKLNATILQMETMKEEIFGLKRVEITYLYCKGGNETEYVEITNNRLIQVNLTGWTIEDTQGSTRKYTLNLALKPGETIKLYRNTTTITWNNQANETAILRDKNGKIISKRKCDVY